MDVQSLYRFDDYTRAKEIMLQRTHTCEAPWWIVNAVDKRRARLNCIRHLLTQVPLRIQQHRVVTDSAGIQAVLYPDFCPGLVGGLH